jgi:uncharacterized membrane protein
MPERLTFKPIVRAGVVLGIGVGGFIDGVFLHQIFQVHAMLSAKVPLDSMANMQTNMTADGLFHSAMLLAVVVGIAMLFGAGKRDDALWSGRALFGAMLMGWGLFNVVEGVIDHHILQLHHVVERFGLSGWDWAFLAASTALIAGGWIISRDRRKPV